MVRQREIPTDIETVPLPDGVKADGGIRVDKLLARIGLAESVSDAARKIKAGAVEIDGVKQTGAEISARRRRRCTRSRSARSGARVVPSRRMPSLHVTIWRIAADSIRAHKLRAVADRARPHHGRGHADHRDDHGAGREPLRRAEDREPRHQRVPDRAHAVRRGRTSPPSSRRCATRTSPWTTWRRSRTSCRALPIRGRAGLDHASTRITRTRSCRTPPCMGHTANMADIDTRTVVAGRYFTESEDQHARRSA